MAKFRKKPVVIEARQYTRIGLEAEAVAKWCGGKQTDEGIIIHTLEGDHLGNYGDWIIQGVNGEFYPCKPDIFKKTYEPVNEIYCDGGCAADLFDDNGIIRCKKCKGKVDPERALVFIIWQNKSSEA